jgi:hypothetical protein
VYDKPWRLGVAQECISLYRFFDTEQKLSAKKLDVAPFKPFAEGNI